MLLNSIKLEKALKQLNSFVSDRDSRPVLQGIHMVYNSASMVLRLEACDSYVADVIELPIIQLHEFDSDTDIVIDPIKVKLSGENVIVNLKELYIEDENNKKVSINVLSYEDYPNLQTCIPNNEVKMEIILSVKNLKKVLKGLDTDDVLTFNISDPYKAVKVYTRKSSELFDDSTMIVSPCRNYV